jgi:MFS family permease
MVEVAAAKRVPEKNSLQALVWASLAGSALEWYDFFLYGLLAASVFGQIFFPAGTDPLVGTLGAFAGFAVGYVARPLGGMIFAHVGDRYGRRAALIATLSLMGGATFLMGLLPPYAQIGIWAPLLVAVLRVMQGLAAGGEWGGAVLILTENISERRRGFYASLPQTGITGGFLLAAVAFFLIQRLAPDDLITWGWRIPFLISIVLFAVGVFIRRRIQESPDFRAAQSEGRTTRLPLIEVLRRQPRELLVATGLRVAENGASVMFAFFVIAYAEHLGIPRGQIFGALIISFAIQVPLVLAFAALSDHVGAWAIYFAGALGMVAFAFPYFWLLDAKTFPSVLISLIVSNALIFGSMYAVQPKVFSGLFPTEVRYSGLTFSREIAAIFIGGLAPLIATALLARFQASWPIALYLAFLGGVTATTLLIAGPMWINSGRQKFR